MRRYFHSAKGKKWKIKPKNRVHKPPNGAHFFEKLFNWKLFLMRFAIQTSENGISRHRHISSNKKSIFRIKAKYKPNWETSATLRDFNIIQKRDELRTFKESSKHPWKSQLQESQIRERKDEYLCELPSVHLAAKQRSPQV